MLICSAIPALATTIWLQHQSDGLFLQYLLEVPSVHPFVSSRFFWLAPYEMISGLIVAVFGIFIVIGILQNRENKYYKKINFSLKTKQIFVLH